MSNAGDAVSISPSPLPLSLVFSTKMREMTESMGRRRSQPVFFSKEESVESKEATRKREAREKAKKKKVYDAQRSAAKRAAAAAATKASAKRLQHCACAPERD